MGDETPKETKLCPLMAIANGNGWRDAECLREKCAWWVEDVRLAGDRSACALVKATE